jgi:nicotinamide-nucleotide amidase
MMKNDRAEILAEEQRRLLADLADLLLARNWTCATAESCTGGLIGAALTEMPGSSRWYRGGIVAYANEIKTGLLDVSPEILAGAGAVSEPAALRMAEGACGLLGSDVSLSVTGVAGPDGGTADKPVGTVWLGWHRRDVRKGWAEKRLFPGNRRDIRAEAVTAAIRGLLARLR